MPIKKIVGLLLFIQLLFGCQENAESIEISSIIPAPNSHVFNKGHFILDETTTIEASQEFDVSAKFLKAFLENGSSFTLEEGSDIRFVYDNKIANQEGYTLEISSENIEIRATSDQGAFHAVQSLRQLLPASFENGTFENNEVALQCITIEDSPHFKYRGMHLDVGRHIFSVAFIKKYIDALALLKMNTFHWHLTEDQGWRIEIKKYPKLNEVAAFRKETLIGHYSDQPHQFDGEVYGGFYTQEEIKDVVDYAQKRHVTIIPEIEMPGHAQAAIAAYPELGCTGEQVEVATKWGVFEEIYCTKDETFHFIQDVLDEVLALFPSKYIHIGGDEAPKTRWKTCASCQNRIASEGLKDEHELQNYFITRIESYLNGKGRQIIGWDEILEGGLAPNATVMSWRGMDGAIKAAKDKHNVVMTPTSHCYFDYYQSDNDKEPLAIGGFLPLEKVYGYNPIPEELNEDDSKFVLGAQGNIWTEYMSTEDQVEYMAFPRMLAMSEVVWSDESMKNYSNFVSRVESFHKRLEALDINYANHLYEIDGQTLTNSDSVSYVLETLTLDKDIRYTLDGTEPTDEAKLYQDPIPISEDIEIKAALFKSKKKLGATYTQNIVFHDGVGKTIDLSTVPHKSYSGSGKEGLINGVIGSNNRYGDKEWLGFWGDDLEITIDLKKETDINSIKTRFHNGKGQWIYAPKYISLGFIDANGKLFKTEMINLKNTDSILVNFEWHSIGLVVQKIRLGIPSFGLIPEGSQGSGNNAWTFIDEIIIN